MAFCSAKSKRTGKPCRAKAMANGKCYHHGGRSHPGGFTHPTFKTGRYAKLPKGMIENYEAALKDPELLSLASDVAAVDARIAELASRLERGESGALWVALQEAMRDHDASSGSVEQMKALARIRDLIIRGHNDHMAATELMAQQDHRRKLVESDRKRHVEMQQMIKGDQALAMISAILDAVAREVSDQALLRRITNRAQAILNAPEAA